MSTFAMDLRYALRSLRTDRRFTLVAASTLALGIGASTAIWTVTKGVLLDPLPYPDGERLELVWSELPESGYVRAPLSGPELDDLRRRSQLHDDFAAIWSSTAALVEENEPETVRLGLVTWNFLPLLGVQPLLGRSFVTEDEGNGVEPRILLSEALFERRFGADPSVLGRVVRLDGGWGFPGGSYRVIGVVPGDFRLVLPHDAGVARDIDVWTPFSWDLASDRRAQYYLRTLARRVPGAAPELAREEIRSIGREIAQEFPEYATTGRAFDAVPLKSDTVGPARPVILALLAGTGFLLMVSCANVASLLLARGVKRREEVVVRTALGATSRQIAAQLLTESLLLAALGGLAGLLLGVWGLRLLLALGASSLPRVESLHLDPAVLATALGTSLLCGALAGLAPVWASRKLELKAGMRTAAAAASSDGSGGRSREAFVALQLALAFVLSFGALLCLRTVANLERVDLGFDPDSVLTMELTLPGERYGGRDAIARLSRELERRIGALPGVLAVGAINQLPLSDLPNWSSPYGLRGRPEGESHEADARVVTPGYFAAVGAREVAGRLFTASDTGDGRPVVVVDELLAERAWPGGSAVGEELELEVRTERGFEPVWAEVVGVVAHMRHHDPRFEVREQLYVPFAQSARNQMALAVRTSSDPAQMLAPVRQQLAAIDSELAVANVRRLDDYVVARRSVQRFTMVLASCLAAVALLLGCSGLYGVTAYGVSARRQEIGLRLALGAEGRSIVGGVLARSLAVGLLGTGLGLLGALGLGRLLAGLLFGVSARDPITLLVVPLVLLAVALLASWLPARRAARTDPLVVMRQD